MNKVNITLKVEDAVLKEVNRQFFDKKGRPKKFKKTKKVENETTTDFSISLSQLNNVIYRKLGGYFTDKNNATLESLVLMKPLELKDLANHIDNLSIKLTKGADCFFELYSRFKKAEFVQLVGAKSCLYCNRNFIHNFNRKTSKQTTAQLDHFYPKKKYPFLAVSLYNLIPCCATCNQRKSNTVSNIFHPYLESFNAATKFVYQGIDIQPKGKNYGFFDETRVKLALETTDSKKASKVKLHKKVFNLEPLYENHKDLVKELIQKSQIYTESYLDQLEKQYVGSVFNSRDELLRLVTGGYVTDDEINQRPLSKLIKDISEQLEIR